nr:probable methyltransferase-like protein 25 isoform X2 [Hydra vulgaris]
MTINLIVIYVVDYLSPIRFVCRMSSSIKEDNDIVFIAKTKSAIDEVLALLRTYHDIINSHLNEYIVKNLSLQIDIDGSSSKDIFVKKCQSIGEIGCCYHAGVNCIECCSENKLKNDKIDKNFKIIKKQQHNSFLSEKKHHEVEYLANIVNQIAIKTKCENIVDFGSGKGYLGYELVYNYGLNVLGVESSMKNVVSSEKRKKMLSKHQIEDKILKSIACHIHPDLIDSSESFIEDLKNNFLSPTMNNALLVGLHSCGNLTCTALKLFSKENYFHGVVMIGCCHNLLENKKDFPMSDYLNQCSVSLERNAFMLACQCPIRWNSEKQKIFEDYQIDRSNLKAVQFRNLGQKSSTFKEYVLLVNDKLQTKGVCFKVEEEQIEKYWDKYKGFWEGMKEYHMVRMQLAPSIEKLILLDRLLYLIEKGFTKSGIVRLFSPVISPRCYAIISLR